MKVIIILTSYMLFFNNIFCYTLNNNVLISNDTEDLKQQAAIILDWAKIFDGHPDTENTNIWQLIEYTDTFLPWRRPEYKLDLANLFPESIKRLLHQKYSYRRGPNCFNFALYASGILPGLRYVDAYTNSNDSEFNFWLNSPLCNRVSPANRKSGDIIVIMEPVNNNQLAFIHSAIYLSDEIAVQKTSIDTSAKYEVIQLKKLLDKYDNGKRFVEYHKCTSIEDFINQYITSDKLCNLMQNIDDIEIEISDEAVYGRNISSRRKLELKNALANLNNKILNQYFASEAFDEYHDFILNSILHRIPGLLKQIDYASN
ncbi:MAG: hypothetical protein JXA66_00570, partial [Oligoflexia bacterium]|nr:hypothetical protein [Oligoflexia bacterium]